MKGRALVILGLAVRVVLGSDLAGRDWRVDLLKEEGIGLTKEALEKALNGEGGGLPDLEKFYQQLGAVEFVDREKAQRKLEAAGEVGLKWLEKRGRSEDPEIQMRALQVIQALGIKHRKVRDSAVEHAARTLLAEGDARRKDTGGVFYEWFGERAAGLGKGYRQFAFKDEVGRGGNVEDGRMVLPGIKAVDGDQRVILTSKEWLGEESFGDAFQVSLKLGGESKGAGAWHLGVSIGKVRILYHPGLAGGAFRFEQVGSRKRLGQGGRLDFKTGGKTLQWMSIEVRSLPDGRVQLEVVVEEGSEGAGRFTARVVIDEADVGKLDQVSLDRSGRAGGAAYFDDFMVRIPAVGE